MSNIFDSFEEEKPKRYKRPSKNKITDEEIKELNSLILIVKEIKTGEIGYAKIFNQPVPITKREKKLHLVLNLKTLCWEEWSENAKSK